MSKKEILILIGVGVCCLLVSGLVSYSIASPKKEKEAVNIVQVGKYTLHMGTYKGTYEEYNPDTNKNETKEGPKIILSKDTIEKDGVKENYTIKGNSIYIKDVEMYQIEGNDKFILLVGSGVEYSYEK